MELCSQRRPLLLVEDVNEQECNNTVNSPMSVVNQPPSQPRLKSNSIWQDAPEAGLMSVLPEVGEGVGGSGP